MAVAQAAHAEAEAAAGAELARLQEAAADSKRASSARELELRAAVAAAQTELASLQGAAGRLRDRLAQQEAAVAAVEALKAQLQGACEEWARAQSHGGAGASAQRIAGVAVLRGRFFR